MWRANSGVPTAEWGCLRRVGMNPSRRSSSAILQREAEHQRPSGLDPAPPHPSGRGPTLSPFTTAPPQDPPGAPPGGSQFPFALARKAFQSVFLLLQSRLREARLRTPQGATRPKTGCFMAATCRIGVPPQTPPRGREASCARAAPASPLPPPIPEGLAQNFGRARVPPGRTLGGRRHYCQDQPAGPEKSLAAWPRPWPGLELDPTYREPPRELSPSPRQAGPPAPTKRPRVEAFPTPTTGRWGLGTLGRSPGLMWAGHLGPRS